MIRIIEQFCEGKFRDLRNEDRIVACEDFCAVVDGSSAARAIGGQAGGIVAAETLVNVLLSLPTDATINTLVAHATTALADVGLKHRSPAPYGSAVVYSAHRREVWRIGDCAFGIDGNWNIPAPAPHERAFYEFRQMMLSGHDLSDRSDPIDHLLILSEAESAWLASTHLWVNAGDEPFAFGALHSRSPPNRFIEVFKVGPDATNLTLASDGAVAAVGGPRAPRSVEAMLDQIAELKRHDPNCRSLYPYWRGFLEGSCYLDDTSFIHFAVE